MLPRLALTLLLLVAPALAACDARTPQPAPAAHATPSPAERVAAALPRFRDEARRDAQDPRMDAALKLVGARDWAAARAQLEAIAADRPQDARAAFLVGYTHHKEKRYAQARPWLERALELGPGFDRARSVFYVYGWCLWYLGEVDGARAAFEAYLELDPEERDAWFGLGLTAIQQGRLDDAARDLQRSVELVEALAAQRGVDAQLAQDLAKAENALADVALARDDLAGARQHLTRAVGAWRDGYEAWFKLSRVLTRLGDDEAAAEALRQHDLARERLGR
ncbi:MAG: tetratricopeptide repeat protein [Planctomycetes bacterium]|nr:tetratricopeptide repeat protein [Planctomycetota bacterium]